MTNESALSVDSNAQSEVPESDHLPVDELYNAQVIALLGVIGSVIGLIAVLGSVLS